MKLRAIGLFAARLMCGVSLWRAPFGWAQAVRAVPYNAQLRTDPDVGNVQGIQRYGRPLKTDPDQGEGYSYYVHPVAYPDQTLVNATGVQGRVAASSGVSNRLKLERDNLRKLQEQLREAEAQNDESAITRLTLEIQRAETRVGGVSAEARSEVLEEGAASSVVANVQAFSTGGPISPYPPPFDATAGIRSWGPPNAPRVIPEVLGSVDGPRAAALNKKLNESGLVETELIDIFHQPLIQIKVRVVEVLRDDSLQAQSVLDYVSTLTGTPSLIKKNTLTPGQVGQEASTRFPLTGGTNPLLGINDVALVGTSGGLVNLTSKHINWVASLLAREFSADVITAPEVVTLNGQNVEFVAGSKIPFDLGQNVTTGATTNVQQFFYKSVGTFVSVTPRIVNWGLHGEGGGAAPLSDAEVLDWNSLIHWVLTKPAIVKRMAEGKYPDLQDIAPYRAEGMLVPLPVKTSLLQILKAYPRRQLAMDVNQFVDSVAIGLRADCDPCHWKPQDCTIDLSLVVRLSEADTAPRKLIVEGSEISDDVTIEKNVRAIANVVQVKSGHGAVIGGLISDMDVESVTKVPVLGDVPVVGALFRSKITNRTKTELLIFLEARVLDSRPAAARAESYEDFTLAQPYVWGEFLDNPLEYGMYRAGFDAYLPPCSHEERIFWERLGRKVRKASTEIDDILE